MPSSSTLLLHALLSLLLERVYVCALQQPRVFRHAHTPPKEIEVAFPPVSRESAPPGLGTQSVDPNYDDFPRYKAKSATSLGQVQAASPPIDNSAAATTTGAGVTDPLSNLNLPPYRYPGGEAPQVTAYRGAPPVINPGTSTQDYRAYKEYEKQMNAATPGQAALVPPILSGTPLMHPQMLRPSEPLGAFGNADFVGDNVQDLQKPFGRPTARQGRGGTDLSQDIHENHPVGSGAAQMSIQNVKTTPGSSCNSWRSCMSCVQFSFCMWNDEGQSCRQEIDVLFSSVHPKYYKTCAMGTYGERVSPSRLKEVPATVPRTFYRPSTEYVSGVRAVAQTFGMPAARGSDLPPIDNTGHFEPSYAQRQRDKFELQSDLAMGARAGMWSMAEEKGDFTSPGGQDAINPEYQTASIPAVGAAVVAREGMSVSQNSPNIEFEGGWRGRGQAGETEEAWTGS